MLHYETTGPDAEGKFNVTYKTPGCEVLTVACAGLPNRALAEREARRWNDRQLEVEEALKADALARGLHGVYPDLEPRTGEFDQAVAAEREGRLAV